MLIKDLGNMTRLFIIPEKKFKTVLIRVQLRADLDDRTTARSVIGDILPKGTKTFPDLKAINRRLDYLYGSSVDSDVSKIADWQANSFTLSMVNEKYIPETDGVFTSAVELLKEVIFDPLVEDGGW